MSRFLKILKTYRFAIILILISIFAMGSSFFLMPETQELEIISEVSSKKTTPFVKNIVIADRPKFEKSKSVILKKETIEDNVQLKKPVHKIINGSGKIAIVIDDVGLNIKQSKRTVDIKFPLTVAVLPYASRVNEFVKMAHDNDHDVIVHMPMQPMNDNTNAGEKVLRIDMNEDAIVQTLEGELMRVAKFSGLNNHMGSKFTQNIEALKPVMRLLKSKGLYFLDSRTIGNSQGENVAREMGVPTLSRDVFLDHEENKSYVRNALVKLEKIASEQGYAIGIGHPKAVTLDALEKWLPDAQSRGFEIVTVKDLIDEKN